MDEIMEYYLEIGAIEISGVDKDGEILFSITEKAKELAPELWQSHQEHIDETLIDLYKKGLIEIEYNENLEAGIKLSDAGIEASKEYGLRFLGEE
jgi:DNA-binding PadR family transcriptional regulator